MGHDLSGEDETLRGRLSGYARVVVTGAGGWVGREALRLLGPAAPGRVIPTATTARRIRVGETDWNLVAWGELPRHLRQGPSEATSLVVHCGFPTQDVVDRVGAREYRRIVGRLRSETLQLLMLLGVPDVVYLSSGAASKEAAGGGTTLRSRVYGEAKLKDEAAFRELLTRLGGRLCVVRAFALSGQHMTKPESYALGDMILQAQRSGSIEVRALRETRRSYMAVDDTLQVAVHAVQQLSPGGCVTFETAGEAVEVGELATRVLLALNGDPTAVRRPTLDSESAPDVYLGDAATLRVLADAAGVALSDLDEQIIETARWLASWKDNPS